MVRLAGLMAVADAELKKNEHIEMTKAIPLRISKQALKF
jgi:hypothetical protein